ncbi:ribbon-helix-helix domain-containing protein [Anatilimnocola floriformis]|uniref:ribbon-helix-helix domain-containing protein n=1 Tax=Anatilimnocola floriformis TaxID=2948575 RepID=UPI0020C46519|nr:ribbon-helix-helix domain-containing protein [Anatilimnocola floriformis]
MATLTLRQERLAAWTDNGEQFENGFLIDVAESRSGPQAHPFGEQRDDLHGLIHADPHAAQRVRAVREPLAAFQALVKRDGAGRKAGAEGKAVLVTASVPSEVAEQFDKLREAKGWTRSYAVSEAIRGLLGKES